MTRCTAMIDAPVSSPGKPLQCEKYEGHVNSYDPVTRDHRNGQAWCEPGYEVGGRFDR